MFFKSKEKSTLKKYCGIFKIILAFVGSLPQAEFTSSTKTSLKELIFFTETENLRIHEITSQGRRKNGQSMKIDRNEFKMNP